MISGPFKPTRTCRVLHRFSPVKTLHHYFFGTLDEWIDGILISWIPNVFTNFLTNFLLWQNLKLWLMRTCIAFFLLWKNCIMIFGMPNEWNDGFEFWFLPEQSIHILKNIQVKPLNLELGFEIWPKNSAYIGFRLCAQMQ